MKRLTALIITLTLLSGCAGGTRLENQAHAVTMGVDYENNQLTITVQVPSFGGSSGEDGKNTGSDYQIYSASAGDFQSAYNILCASIPQKINLSHLKGIVFSENFAESGLFCETVHMLLNMFSLSGNAVVIVSRTEASKLVENQKPYIGMRLSQILPAMLDYRSEEGYIPLCTLSNLFAGMLSVYSTPAAVLAATAESNKSAQNVQSYLPGELNREGMNKNEYIGTALFNRKCMTGILNGRETQLLHFLRGEKLKNVEFSEPYDMRVSVEKERDVAVVTEGERVRIEIDMYLRITPLVDYGNMDAAAENFRHDLLDVIDKCRKMDAEPFGFAEHAAKDFLTFDKWNEFDWLNAFKNAEIRLNLHTKGTK